VTGLIREQVNRLAGVLADLKARVRAALAGEIARAVAGAVQEVVRAVVAGQAERTPPQPTPAFHRPGGSRWDDGDGDWGRSRDSWDDRDDWDDDGASARPGVSRWSDDPCPPAAPVVPTAVAAGVHVGRWWLSRKGTLLAALVAGLAVGLLGLAGGPTVRAAVATLATAADLVAVTDALGDGAARIDHP
jgi:hypothetical protein